LINKNNISLSTINKDWAGQLVLSSCPEINKEYKSLSFQKLIATFKDDNISLVVTLLDTIEVTRLDISTLGKFLKENNIYWEHFPIQDLRIPTERNLLIKLLVHMKKLLDDDKSVLIHCYAGLGRTGLLATTLLVSLGLEAKVSIEHIRKIRPGSIETIEQENFVKQWDFRFK
jgi:protein-tyrosine phosphatase